MLGSEDPAAPGPGQGQERKPGLCVSSKEPCEPFPHPRCPQPAAPAGEGGQPWAPGHPRPARSCCARTSVDVPVPPPWMSSAPVSPCLAGAHGGHLRGVCEAPGRSHGDTRLCFEGHGLGLQTGCAGPAPSGRIFHRACPQDTPSPSEWSSGRVCLGAPSPGASPSF